MVGVVVEIVKKKFELHCCSASQVNFGMLCSFANEKCVQSGNITKSLSAESLCRVDTKLSKVKQFVSK